jgi:tetratricopeptide (TPR) repeat protein
MPLAQADFVERGRQLCARAQYQEAVKVCRLGLLAHPTEVEGRLVLGEALLALSRHDEVLAEMRVALELDGENPRALGLKGAALLRKGDVLQACDVLARAVTGAPSDPTLRQLYGEARSRREAAQQTGGRGGNRWQQPSMPPQREPGRPHPRSGLLAIGDQSGTIEIDPDVDDVEIASVPGRSATDMSEPAIELSTSDLLPEPPAPIDSGIPSGFDVMDGPFAPRPSARIPPLEAPVDRQLTGPNARLARPSMAPSPSFDPGPLAEPGGGRRGKRNSQAPGGGRPSITEMFPEDDGGVSRMELDRGSGGFPRGLEQMEHPPQGFPGPGAQMRGAVRSRSEDMRTIREGLGLPAESMASMMSAGPAPAPAPAPGWAGGSPPGVFPAVGPRGPHPLGPHGSHGPQPARGQPRDRGGDIPRGRSRVRRAAEPIQQGRPAPGPILTRGQRRGLPLYVYALIGVIVVAGAVLAGFWVRDIRLSGQIASAREAADQAAAADTYPGYLMALDAYARIAEADDDLDHRAAHAALAARAAAEVGDGLDEARRLVAGLGQETGLAEALAARAFLAVAEEDAARATAAAAELRKAAPGHPDADHLAGRAALLAGRPADAAPLLRAALEKSPRPSIAVALARAEAEQGRFAEARTALDRAVQLRPKHAGASIWSARIAVWGKSLPARDDPEKALQALVAEGGRPPAQQVIGASPSQAAWAALVLAEVHLARGKRAEALRALASAQASTARGGFAFRSSLAEILVSFGQLAGARAQVALTVKEWPNAVSSRLLEARVAMAGGDPGSALAALDKAGDIASHPEALALRGRARLAVGAVTEAAADLDAALALSGDQQSAILARAEVDLARGAARAARKRLAGLYGDGESAPVEVVAAYAAALRQSGDRAEARKLLAELSDRRPREAGDWRVLVEQARLARSEGAFPAAAGFYAKAIAASPRALEARLEAAALALDTGDLAGARSQLDTMLGDGAESGPILVDAARVRILSGDHPGATQLLDKAGGMPTPSWKVARERGRLLLRQRRPEPAVAELDRAKAAMPDDGETRILLMEAYVAGKDARGAAAELVQLTKTFRGTSALALGRGFEAMARERWRDAAAEMARAYDVATQAGEPPRMAGRAAYWTGRALYLDDKVPKAVEWLERSLEHDRSLADAQYLLGQIAFEGQSPERMVKRFEKAVNIDPAGNPSAWFFLGEHYLSKRRYDQARAALQTYLDRWPEADFSGDARDLLAKIP